MRHNGGIMDLILWRHAEAQEHPDPLNGVPGDAPDLARCLSARGEKQAARMGAWLDRQLPNGARVLVSPARRCEQTAQALGRKFKLCNELAPQGDALDLLQLAQWPSGKAPVLLVGHQPALGRVVARLLGLSEEDCPVKRGAVWWLRERQRGSTRQTVVVTVQSPELI